MNNQSIRDRLNSSNASVLSAYCIVAAFGTYFCMYAFRKPFTAATYENLTWLGIGYKTILVSAQVAGYTLSKFIGIKVVSEMSARYRAASILGLIAIAEVALALFALTPFPWNFVWLFVNGLPLGMVFGLVIGFLEGRKVTEALSAGLCASFIVSSGYVKSVGRWLIEDYQVDPFWMPFYTGLIFAIPLLLFVWMLSQIPPPNEEDQRLRTKRQPMNRQERNAFFKRHALGLIGLLAIYILLTIVRSIRDDFAVEIWQEMGVEKKPSVFAQSETWVMIGVTLINGLAICIRNNRLAFLASLFLVASGFVVVAMSVFGYQSDRLSPMGFMVVLGLGMYVPYVAFHTTVFERMIASFQESGTIGYVMYLADAVGYLGYVAVMLLGNWLAWKEANPDADSGSSLERFSYLGLMTNTSLVVAALSTGIIFFLLIHYSRTVPEEQT